MKITINDDWRISASHEIELPLPAASAWGQMRDITGFLSMDPLHTRVRLGPAAADSGTSPRGRALKIPHRFCGIGPDRVGRVLRWQEGRGFAISDLSKRGMRVGFPHVCSYEVVAAGPNKCLLSVGVRGRWTATFLPRWVVRAWMWWVLRATQARIERHFLAFTAWRRRRKLDGQFHPVAPNSAPPAGV